MSSTATIPGDPSPDDFYDAAPLEPHLLYHGEILVESRLDHGTAFHITLPLAEKK